MGLFLTSVQVGWVVSDLCPGGLGCFWPLFRCVRLFLTSLQVGWAVSDLCAGGLGCFWPLCRWAGLFLTSALMCWVVSDLCPDVLGCFWPLSRCVHRDVSDLCPAVCMGLFLTSVQVCGVVSDLYSIGMRIHRCYSVLMLPVSAPMCRIVSGFWPLSQCVRLFLVSDLCPLFVLSDLCPNGFGNGTGTQTVILSSWQWNSHPDSDTV